LIFNEEKDLIYFIKKLFKSENKKERIKNLKILKLSLKAYVTYLNHKI
jgi:hypothetical protein